MKFLEITMRNFMPYKGEQRVKFPAAASKNVMLVFGENMRGKTSFLNAIRWALYGEVFDRDGRRIGLADLANMDAGEQGDWSFGVYLTFEADGVEYDLRRVATPNHITRTPRRDSDFEIDASLKRGNKVVRADEVEHLVNQLMPEQVSRFFLFDAELLAEYQELLSEDSDQGHRIKESIEQVLGVPALINGRNEIRALLKRAQDVLAKENRHTEGMKSQSEQFQRLAGELSALNADFASLRAKEDSLRADLAAIETLLSQTEAAQKVHVEAEGLRKEKARLKDREGELHIERTTLIADAWKDLLQPRLQAHVRRLESERSKYQGVLESRGAIGLRIKQLQDLIARKECTVCEQPIDPSNREKFGKVLGGLEAELAAVSANMERVGLVSSEITSLAAIGSSGARARFERNESDLNRLAVAITKADADLAELEARVKGYDSVEIARQRARHNLMLQHLGRLQEEIGRTQRDIDERSAKQDQLSRLMMRAPGARSKRSAREVQIYSGLEKLFAKSIDTLRERLKKKVAAQATSAFRALTTERTYSGLRINENYGLVILDRDNRQVSVRSAGAEQIVALALIDGLNRTARKSGPIIIDTPLGRLDPRHRANVLKYIPTMADQVILLVHEGEITREAATEVLGPKIGGVYEIERISSSHSEIRKA